MVLLSTTDRLADIYCCPSNEERQRFDRLQNAYEDFANRVAEAAERRMARSGLKAVLSLIPGANLIGILGDLVDVFDDTIDVADAVGDAVDSPELKDLEIGVDDLTLLYVSPEKARNLLGVLGGWKVIADPKAFTPDAFEDFISEVIKRAHELTRDLTADQRKKIITRIAVKFGPGFGVEYERSEETVGQHLRQEILPISGKKKRISKQKDSRR